MLGKTERRLAMVILLTAIIPLAMAIWLAYAVLNRASILWLNPDVDQQLERNVSIYKDYIRSVKDDMKHQADAIAADHALRDAASGGDRARVHARLDALFPAYPELVSLRVSDADGDVLASRDRGRPVDDANERKLDQRRELAVGGVARPPGDDYAGPLLTATFAFDRRYEDDLKRAGEVRDTYDLLQTHRDVAFAEYSKRFAALLFVTMIMTVALGFVLARGVTKRISRLANAINVVARGDLSVRVPVTGSDEITELSRVFNRMLGEMQQSRARIEYLQRIGAWQEMAQRLAHEIKNPLTPIQLAVQECHRKYPGDDAKYRSLLDTTLEVVEEEVGTLRRLVGNFSDFARLPQVELREASLRDFLRECSEQLHVEIDSATEQSIDVSWELPEGPMPAAIDRQMLKRVLANLVRNAMQAIRDAQQPDGKVVVSAAPDGDGAALVVEDNGPGVREDARDRIFDPYFTTKVDGTGLGLAIVKKIVVEHGGSIEVARSERLGGASFVVHLPGARSLALQAVRPAPSQPQLSS